MQPSVLVCSYGIKGAIVVALTKVLECTFFQSAAAISFCFTSVSKSGLRGREQKFKMSCCLFHCSGSIGVEN